MELILYLSLTARARRVRLRCWPISVKFSDAIASALCTVALLIAAAVALVVGAAIVWISELRQRRRARHAEAAVRRLEEQVRELQARLHPPTASPPKN